MNWLDRILILSSLLTELVEDVNNILLWDLSNHKHILSRRYCSFGQLIAGTFKIYINSSYGSDSMLTASNISQQWSDR